MLLLNPALWKAGSVGIARFVLAPLAVSVTPTWYLGTLIQAPPLPAPYPTLWLLFTTPLAMLLAALFALPLCASSKELRKSWRASPTLDLAALALLGLGSALLPTLLLRFPSFLCLASPLIAVGFVWTLLQLQSSVPRVAHLLAPGVVLLAALPGLLELPTAGASFGVISGGAVSVLSNRVVNPVDGSELANIAPALDALGRDELSIALPPDVPKHYFELLQNSRRLRTRVAPTGQTASADAALAFGPGPATAAVTRDGATLWRIILH
jgi:hypothetical protein